MAADAIQVRDCKLPKFGKAVSHFRMDVAYESDPCYDCLRLLSFADGPAVAP
jgi:hypothetical protein